VAAARSLTDHALRLFVHGQEAVPEVSMAKRTACALAVEVAEAALHLYAAEPWPARAVVERALRDARLGPIGGGTTQIMDEVIARTAGL
jgi:acyl-CoA dehydrogenase